MRTKYYELSFTNKSINRKFNTRTAAINYALNDIDRHNCYKGVGLKDEVALSKHYIEYICDDLESTKFFINRKK